MPNPDEMTDFENVAEGVAEAPLDDVDVPAGVTEAIALYEAAVRQYSTAATYYDPVARVSGSSSTVSW